MDILDKSSLNPCEKYSFSSFTTKDFEQLCSKDNSLFTIKAFQNEYNSVSVDTHNMMTWESVLRIFSELCILHISLMMLIVSHPWPGPSIKCEH